MTCTTCNEARSATESYRLFADYCLHCAARRIQFIQRSLNLAPDAIRARCRTALAQAMELGLPEQEIRRLAKLPEWQIQQPEDAPTASSPVPRKRGR